MRSSMMLLVVLAAGCTTKSVKFDPSHTGGSGSGGDAGLGGGGGTVVGTGGGTAGTTNPPTAGHGGGGTSATGRSGPGTGGEPAAGGGTDGGAGSGLGTGGRSETGNGGGGVAATGGIATGGLSAGAGGTLTGTGGLSAGAGGTLTGGTSSAGTGGTAGQADAGDHATCAFVGPCTSTVVYFTPPSVTTTTFVYDAKNQLIREEADRNGDGAPDHIVRYSYDEHGWLLERKSDECDSGSSLGCMWLSYTYDTPGHVLTENDRSFYSGRVAGCTTFTYDDSGHLLKSEFSGGCSGTVQEVIVYGYDPAGRLISKRWDFNGTPNSGITYQYDDAGLLASEFHDAKYDGTIDEVVTYTRNAAGLPLVEEHRMAAGSLVDDYRIIRTYDQAGNQLTERTQYLKGVLVATEESCFARTYDDCGNVRTEDYGGTCDQTFERRTTYSYECFAP